MFDVVNRIFQIGHTFDDCQDIGRSEDKGFYIGKQPVQLFLVTHDGEDVAAELIATTFDHVRGGAVYSHENGEYIGDATVLPSTTPHVASISGLPGDENERVFVIIIWGEGSRPSLINDEQ